MLKQPRRVDVDAIDPAWLARRRLVADCAIALERLAWLPWQFIDHSIRRLDYVARNPMGKTHRNALKSMIEST